MSKPSIYPISSRLTTLLSLFSPGINLSDEIHQYLESLEIQDRNNLRDELIGAIRAGSLGAVQFRLSTSFDAASEELARLFFQKVYAYGFEGGDEPDVTNYTV